ncbi:MAG: TetR/AcrR family transcriptional regulator [Alphaproteobacteria bacterium]
MPWQKSFDRKQAIEQAMHLFWRRGYEGTSMAELVEATGASRYGLYDEFGDKRGLFLAALDRYLARLVKPNYRALNRKTAGLDEIRSFFEAFMAVAGTPVQVLGCLMCHTASRPIARDIDVAKRVAFFMDVLKGSFANALGNAKAAGALPRGAKPHDMAIFFAGLVLATSLLCRAETDAETTRTFLQTGLTVLGDA